MILTHRFFVLFMIGLLWSSCRKETTEVPRVPRAVPVENSSGSDNVILKTDDYYGPGYSYNSTQFFASEKDFHSYVEVSGSMYFQLYSKISTTINMTLNMSPRKLGSIIDTVKTPDIALEVSNNEVRKVVLDDSIINKLKKFRNIGLFYMGGSDRAVIFLKKFAKKVQKPLHVAVVLEKSSLIEKFKDVDNLVSLKVYLSEWEERIDASTSFKNLKNLEIRTPCQYYEKKFNYNSIVDLALVQEKLRTLRIHTQKQGFSEPELDNSYFLQLKKRLRNFKKFYIESAPCGDGGGLDFFQDNGKSRALNMLFDPAIKKPIDRIMPIMNDVSEIGAFSEEELSQLTGITSNLKSINNLKRLNKFKNYKSLTLEVPVNEELFKSITSLKYIEKLYLTGDTSMNLVEFKGPEKLKTLKINVDKKNSGLSIATKNLLKLEKITLSGNATFQKVGFPEKLKELNIGAGDIKPDAFNASELKNLKNIYAEITEKNISSVFSLLNLKNLKEVHLRCKDNKKPLNLKSISEGVKKIILDGCILDKVTFNTIFKSRTNILKFEDCILPSGSINFPKTLIELKITNMQISNDFLSSIFDANLKKLTLKKCKFHKDVFEILTANKSIEELLLDSPNEKYNKNNFVIIKNIKLLKKIKFLKLYNFYINSDDLKKLAEAPALEILELYEVNFFNNENTTIDLNSSKTLRYIIDYDGRIKFAPLTMK